MNILLTGFTGNVGHAIAEALSDCHVHALVRDPRLAPNLPHVTVVTGLLATPPMHLAPQIDVIVHAAADTSFRTPLEELRATNVECTRHLLEFGSRCPRLQRFIHLSTTCVSGTACGIIPEGPVTGDVGFVNSYERSKWEAEQLIAESDLPAEILRLSIVIGRERDGVVRRLGALHQTMRWLWRGLIPMIPGDNASLVDVVSADFVARVLRAMLTEPPQRGRIVHAASGDSAPRLGDLLDLVFGLFARHHDGWARGVVERPVLADSESWRLFSAAAMRSGDALFARVISDAQSFLPLLLHRRVYATSVARRVVQTDWENLVERTAEWLIRTNWNRPND